MYEDNIVIHISDIIFSDHFYNIIFIKMVQFILNFIWIKTYCWLPSNVGLYIVYILASILV